VRNSNNGYRFNISMIINNEYSPKKRLFTKILPHMMRRREVPKYTVNTPQRNAHKPPTWENPASTDSSLESEIVIHSEGSSCKKTRKVEVLRDRGMRGESPALGSEKMLITRAIMMVFNCCTKTDGRSGAIPRASKKSGIRKIFPVQKLQRSCTVAVTRGLECPLNLLPVGP